jgi:hypothetical protein
MMRSAVMALAACTLVAGCSDNDNPAGPSTAPLVFAASLSPANEVPAVSNAESSGRGAAQITIITISGGTVRFYVQLAGFPGDTRMQAAHIHRAGAGINGPVVVDTGIVAASPVVLNNGSVEFTSSAPIAAALLDEIVANPAGFYFNVHSPLNPGGFARGQLQRVQ